MQGAFYQEKVKLAVAILSCWMNGSICMSRTFSYVPAQVCRLTISLFWIISRIIFNGIMKTLRLSLFCMCFGQSRGCPFVFCFDDRYRRLAAGVSMTRHPIRDAHERISDITMAGATTIFVR